MSHEVTNTKSRFKRYPPIPEGRRRFVVVAPVRKMYGKSGSEFYVWALQYKNDYGENALGEQPLMPSMMGPLLRVLGCQEDEPDVFDWDTDDVEGRAFVASVSYTPDKKDSTIIRVHFSEYAHGDSHENAPQTTAQEPQN